MATDHLRARYENDFQKLGRKKLEEIPDASGLIQQGGTPVKRILSVLCLVALCAFMGINTMAQSTTGNLIGSVVDPDGKAVVGATVTVTDSATNQSEPAVKSGDGGRFAFNNLPPGHYKVTVSMPNFKTTVDNDVEIITSRTYELPVKLEVGGANVEVTVVAGQQLLETANTSTQATVSGRSITNLPLTAHSALLLATLDPGAQTVGGPRNTTFEGLPKGTINVTFDGINSQDNVLKSNDGFFAVNDPRIDDIEEFGITTSANDPSKTGQGAVQMSFVSKRGGNAFHGGVWEYNRNTAFDSNYYFNNAQGLPRQVVQLNDYGYKVGGPILKDKLFFFTDFDFFQFPQSVTRSRTIYTTGAKAVTALGIVGSGSAAGFFNYVPVNSAGVPTLPTAQQQLAASSYLTCNTNAANPLCTVQLLGANGLAATGGVAGLPTAIDPILVGTPANPGFLAAVEGAATASGVTVSSALVSPYQESIGYNSKTSNTRKYPDIRMDYNLTKHHSLEFDYHYSHLTAAPDLLNNRDATFPVAPFNTSVGTQLSNRNLFVIAERWNIGSNMSNELRFGLQSSPINFGLGINNGLFPTISTNFLANTPVSFALFGVSTLFQPLGALQGRNTPLGELHETFGWTHGSHQFSFGGDATYLEENDFFNFNASVGLNLDTTHDPAAAAFGACTTKPTDPVTGCVANLPNMNSTDQGNVENLYTSLTGRISSFTSAVFQNQKTHQFDPTQKQQDQLRQLEMGIFAGDSWRFRPNLTLNYGLRWEYDGPPWDNLNEYTMVQNTNDVFGISGPGNLFHPGSTAGNGNEMFVSDAGKSWYNRYMKAFAPSVGFAYQPNWDSGVMHHLFGGSGKTVLRAGFSLAYSREGLNSFFGIAQGNPFTGSQFANSASANNAANGQFQAGTIALGQTTVPGQTTSLNLVAQSPVTNSTFFALNPLATQSVNAFDPNLRPPMVESWNAGIQRELSPNLALEIRYQANHGVGLTDQFNLNEVNIFENGFLNEFNNAENNLAICKANAAACITAQTTAGVVKPSSSSFGNYGLAGQVNLPILTAAFTGSKTGPQTSSLFTNSTFIADLGVQGVGSFANTIGGTGLTTSAANFNSFLANLQTAGFPSNFFVVNPTATGGSFITTNGAQSTYNALIVDLRHRPSHGLQFDVSYTFSKSLTNYQVNSSLNFQNFTTLRNPGYDKGPAPFNAAHAVKAQLVYALPFGAGHRWSSSSGVVNRIIGGWEVDSITRFQTGQPVLVTSGVTGGNTFNNNGPGINLIGLTRQQIQSMLTTNKTAVPGAVTYVPASLLDSSLQRANSAVFQPCNVAGSLCSKPFFTGPSFFRADISLVKTTKITERVNFEMRMEALNALNDADFYWAGGVGTSPQSISTQSTRFGLMGSTNTNGAYSDINTTQDPGGRIIQLVGRINF
jgi:hypothetical protein